MTKNVAGAVLMVGLAAALAACSSAYDSGPPVNPNIYPSKYKQQIIDTLRHVLNDPTHVRNAEISDPVLSQVFKEQRYTACVRLSERDFQTGQYKPPETRIAFFYGGKLNQFVKAEDDQCANAAYKPFPEAEKLCLAKKCQ